jgi:hypothetical protein
MIKVGLDSYFTCVSNRAQLEQFGNELLQVEAHRIGDGRCDYLFLCEVENKREVYDDGLAECEDEEM